MLGTERQPAQPLMAYGGLRALLKQLDTTQREDWLLGAAALSAVYERAGVLPSKDSGELDTPCAPELSPMISGRGGSLLGRLLEGEYAPLLPECLELMARAQRIAPPELLPGLLASGATHAELRELIMPVLGARGLWLAARNPDWSWVGGAGPEESAWSTGKTPARLRVLRRLRQTNPAQALDLLKATWQAETPEDRAAFVAELATGLSSSDEPFLEAALDDKRKEIRRVAASLLSRLPDSALVRRLTELVRPLLKFTPAESGTLLKLKRGRKAVLEITLPPACDKAMQRDGIEIRPQSGFGEKAWWLIQILEIVPLTTWTNEWRTTPAEILSASESGEFKKELFEGWTRAAVHQREATWADALLTTALEGSRFDKLEPLLSALPPDLREARASAILTEGNAKTRDLHGLIVTQCHHGWSPEFSRAVLRWLRHLTAMESVDWSFRNQLKDLAARLAPAVLGEALEGWPTNSKGWVFWSTGVDEFLAATQLRFDLHQALTD